MNTQTILNIEDLHISFDLDYYLGQSIRDRFVQFCQNPIKSLFGKQDNLYLLRGVNFKIDHGDRVGLLGVNGAGKTTICRCIMGMYTPSHGQIEKRGEIRPLLNTEIGIYPELTGRENAKILSYILFPELKNVDRNEIINEAVEFSELGHFIDSPFKTYSKGMKTRLCLSLVTARPSDLLVMDEVYDGADEFFAGKVAKRVMKMIEQSGGVLFVSHSPDQLRQTCNRVLVLRDGIIQYDGEVEKGIEFYRQYNQ